MTCFRKAREPIRSAEDSVYVVRILCFEQPTSLAFSMIVETKGGMCSTKSFGARKDSNRYHASGLMRRRRGHLFMSGQLTRPLILSRLSCCFKKKKVNGLELRPIRAIRAVRV